MVDKKHLGIGFAVIGILMLSFAGASLLGGGSDDDINDETPIVPEPPVIITQTVVTSAQQTITITTEAPYTTTQPPMITSPTATQPPVTIQTTVQPPLPPKTEGEIAVEGRFGIYDGRENPVNTGFLWFTVENEPVHYFRAFANFIEVYGTPDLLPKTMVVYFRTQMLAKDGTLVKVMPDLVFWEGHFNMKGRGYTSGSGQIDVSSGVTRNLGTIDLNKYWYGIFDQRVQSKNAEQKIAMGQLFLKVGWPIDPYTKYRQYDFTFIQETFMQIIDTNGKLHYGYMERHKLWVTIEYVGEDGMFSVTGASSPIFGLAPEVIAIIGMGILVIVYMKRDDLKRQFK